MNSRDTTIPRVIFFPVKSSQVKLQKIAKAARHHFRKKERFLVLVADDKSASFVDDLLWKIPSEGFLPHLISSKEESDYIVITSKKKNLNNAKFIFNLCPTPLFLENSRLIYEFEDLTTPNRQMLSRKRFEAYREAKYIIETLE